MRQGQDLLPATRKLSEFAESLGFPYAMAGLRMERNPSSPVQIILTTYPRAWLRQYDDQEYTRIDPVLRRARESLLPFFWDEISLRDSAISKLFSEAASYGLAHGLSCPVHGPNRDFGLLSLARPTPIQSCDERNGLLSRAMQWALQYFSAMFSLWSKGTSAAVLTERQREVLELVSKGRSVKWIAHALSVHQRTVEDLLRRAYEALGAESRMQAVLFAYASGQIAPNKHAVPLRQSTILKTLPSP
ncbi:MAG: LuxR family transcriptional regulator [Gammaproteobacteria bacterium]|nr:LuxR family transcriptional regulator [Gammaproteobacteria bacterium]